MKHLYLLTGATHAAVLSLPFNANVAYSEGERFSSQLISLREHIAFRKLGMYGKSTYRKHHSPENINKTLQPTATTPTTISEIDSSVVTNTVPPEVSTATNTIPSSTNTISLLRNNVPPASKPDIPMPVEDKPSDVPAVKLREPSPPASTGSRYVTCCVSVLLISCVAFILVSSV